MNKEQKIQAVRDYCEDDLRNGSQTDNLYFGTDKGSIYWVEGAETWCYVCGNITEWGQCGDLLHGIKKKILLDYYNKNKEDIDEYLEYKNERIK